MEKVKSSSSGAGASSAAVRALLLRAWRERWGDVLFGIHIKTVIRQQGEATGGGGLAAATAAFDDQSQSPSSAPWLCPGDAVQISEQLLSHALTGSTPNALFLGYLRHCVAARIASHSALLASIAAVSDSVFERPHCTVALIRLSEEVVPKATSASALAQIAAWLLTAVSASLARIESRAPSTLGVDTENYESGLKLLRKLAVETEFTAALLYIGKKEEPEAQAKIVAMCKQLNEQVSQTQVHAALKQEVTKLTTALKTLDPKSLTVAESKASSVGGFPFVQPLLAYEAVLRPTSDLTGLSQQLYTQAFQHGLSFSELLYLIFRSCLISVGDSVTFDALKWDAFILIRLPALLEKLAALMRVDSSQLKTPTEAYKAFDRLLNNERVLLDSVDVKCSCNVVENLLVVCGGGGSNARPATPALLTETESDDVLKKRLKMTSEAAVPPAAAVELLSEDILGGGGEGGGTVRMMDVTVKASDKMSSILKTLEEGGGGAADVFGGKPEAIESLLGVLSQIVNGESFDLLLAAASANGKLLSFVRSIIKFNQFSQESQGESVKNSLLRATLFDITFLMLVHIVQSFSPGTVLRMREAKGTLIESWTREMLIEEDRVKQMAVENPPESTVDQLLQQLNGGELRTQVVKWQTVCVNIHLALKEMVFARVAGQLQEADFKRMMSTACSKLASLPVCMAAWLLSFRMSYVTSPTAASMNLDLVIAELMEIVAGGEVASASAVAGAEMPHARERVALMRTVVGRMEELVGRKKRLRPVDGGKLKLVTSSASLSGTLLGSWQRICDLGFVDVPTLRALTDVYRIGGRRWFVESLLEELLSVAYQDDLERQTDILAAVFHLDLEGCTEELLGTVLPGMLQVRAKRRRLTDPHGTAVAKVAISCLYGLSKRSHANASSDEPPDAKSRRLDDGSGATSSEPSAEVTAALTCLLSRLRLISDEPAVSPGTHFAADFVTQAARRGRSKAWLVLQHLPLQTVANLVRAVPERFSMQLVSQVFDSSTPAGRKSAARVMCLLKNVEEKRERAAREAAAGGP